MAGPGASSRYVNIFTGSASYSIPVEVPPGRKGMQPDIALVYNSGGGNGPVGVGWNLTGMNCIWRSTKRGVPNYQSKTDFEFFEFLINGISGELVLTYQDCQTYSCVYPCSCPGNVTLSCGQPTLVACTCDGGVCFQQGKNCTYQICTDNYEYRNKIESSYLKFKRTITNNQDTWEVRDKNGTLIYFSSDPSKRIGPNINTASGTYKWCADYMEDKNGNRMRYNYLKDGRELYLQSILYTGNTITGVIPKQKVELVYENRSDSPIRYIAGFDQRFAKRLKEIRTMTSTDGYNFILVKRYVLNYTYSLDSSRSLLSSVKEYGRDGVTGLPEIAFNYTHGTSGYSWVSSNIPHDFLYQLSTYTFDLGSRLLEINGDGFVDFVQAWCGGFFNDYRPCDNSADTYIYLNQKNNNTPFGNGLNNIFPRSITYFLNYTDLGVRVLDVNGDGKDDIVKAIDGVRETFLGTPSGWGYAPQYNLPVDLVKQLSCAGQTTGQLDNGVRFGDVNGDGLIDIIHNRDSLSLITYPKCGQPRKADIYINTGSGWQKQEQENDLSSIEPFVIFRVADPLWFSSVYTVSRGENVSDINGDGLADIVLAYKNSDGTDYKRTYINTGGSWSQDTTWIIPEAFIFFDAEGKPHDRGVRLTDINYDGLVDIVQSVFFVIGGIEKIYLNNGNGWAPFASNSNPTYFPAFFSVLDKDMGVRFGDVNGDGLTDVVQGVIADSIIRNIWHKSGSKPDLLTTVTNGIGGTIAISYGHSNQFDNTCGDGVYDGVPDLPYPLPVVTSITVSDGRGWQSGSQYWYECGKYDSQEREFRGFRHVRVTDAQGNYTDHYFAQDSIYAGRPTRTEVRSQSGALFNKTEYTWASIQPNTGVYIPYVQSQKSYTCDGDATCRVTQIATTIDNYVNTTGIYNYGECPEGNCNNLNGDESATVISYIINQDKNIFGLPKGVINSGFVISGGNYVLTTPYLKQQWLYYDNLPLGQVDKGNITQIEQWNSGGIDPVTTISYDSYGNPVTITDPRGNPTTILYDSFLHVFPIQVTNALGHTETTEYDTGTGNVTKRMNENGIIIMNMMHSDA